MVINSTNRMNDYLSSQLNSLNMVCMYTHIKKKNQIKSRGSVGWACVTNLSFCFEEILYRNFHKWHKYQISVHLATWFQRRRFFYK